MKSFSQLPLLPDSFGFLRGTGPSPSRPLWTVQFCCHGYNLLLSTYLCRIKRKREFFLQRLRTPSLGSNSLPFGLSRICMSLSGVPSLALFLPFLTSGPDFGAWPDCWVSVEFLLAPIPRKGSGSTTTTVFTTTG